MMTVARITMVCALAAGAACAWPSSAVRAQDWSGSTPVFRSDVEARQRQMEEQREARRKSYGPTVYPKFMEGGEKPEIVGEKPPIAYLDQAEEPGTIIVDTGGRRLLYVLPGKQAYLYPISVGRDGFTWTGSERISRIASWPTWTPPPEMRQRQPGLPVTVTGGVINPLGARALYLGNTIYRIHGTNNPRSIGRASSSGCFRMMNEHVIHLTTLARVGTKVRVVANYTGGVSTSAPIASLFSFGSSDEPAAKPAAKAGKAVKSAKSAAKTKTASSN